MFELRVNLMKSFEAGNCIKILECCRTSTCTICSRIERLPGNFSIDVGPLFDNDLPLHSLVQGRSNVDEFEYRGSKRFVEAASPNAAARSISNEAYEPVASNARPSITGPIAPAAA